ncbi:MAG: DoxX family membrane protein [Deltaproteobacteria bacterium]|nr:DoxX family membrane protein [Deltaproteobacteria bacterium]
MNKEAQQFAVAAVLLIFPSLVDAHIKWFVDETTVDRVGITHFSLMDPVVLVWIGVILSCIVAAAVLERFLPQPLESLVAFVQVHRQKILRLFQIMVGLTLLLTAVRGAIIAPHLKEEGQLGLLLRFVEGGIGVLLIANIAVRLGGALLVALYAASAGLFGFISSLEYFNFLGVALFLLFNSAPADSQAREYALPLLRVHTGIALSVLAWTEKLHAPHLAMSFLKNNKVNFMQTLGFDLFSDRLFVLSAGCTELVFGIIFVLGLITRLNTLALVGFLVSSNLYFFMVGKTDEAFLELSGHLPLIAISILFVMLGGGGDRLRLQRRFFSKGATGKPHAACLSSTSDSGGNSGGSHV